MGVFSQQLPGLSIGLLRIMFGILWLDAALQKAPWVINAQGARFGWLSNWIWTEMQHPTFAVYKTLLENVVWPHLTFFGYMSFVVEMALGLSLLLGVCTVLSGLGGALWQCNIALRSYSVPGGVVLALAAPHCAASRLCHESCWPQCRPRLFLSQWLAHAPTRQNRHWPVSSTLDVKDEWRLRLKFCAEGIASTENLRQNPRGRHHAVVGRLASSRGAIIRRLALEVMWPHTPPPCRPVGTCRHLSPPVGTICRCGALVGAPLRTRCLPPRTCCDAPWREGTGSRVERWHRTCIRSVQQQRSTAGGDARRAVRMPQRPASTGVRQALATGQVVGPRPGRGGWTSRKEIYMYQTSACSSGTHPSRWAGEPHRAARRQP